jgi:PAS domain S-box-containing protein
MSWEYFVLASMAGVLSMSLALSAWSYRRERSAVYFILLMLAISVWSFASAVESMPWDVATKILWSQISYIGIVSVGPLWLLLVLSYSQVLHRWPRWRILALWAIPIIVLGLVATNGWHGLIWAHVTPVSDAPGALVVYGRGIGFWINASYIYLSMLIGTILLIRTTLRSTQLYRRQISALLLGAILPWIGNLWYLLRLPPLPELDKAPIAFALSGLMVAYGLFRFRMFDIVPVARDVLIEKMADGVLVLDARDRLVDVNPAACHLFGYAEAHIIGHPISVVLAKWDELLACYQDVAQVQTEIIVGDERWFDLNISPLYNRRQQFSGRLIVLRDITARKQTEMALERYAQELQMSNTELDAFAHTVAHDLKSPLSVVIGYSQLLEMRYARLEDAERLEMLAILRRNGQSMARIIDELLTLAGIRQMDEVPMIPFDMGAVIAEAQERLRLLIQEHDAAIDMPETWPGVLGYAPWIEEVWANYLSNAIKYGGDPANAIPPHMQLGWDAVPASSDAAGMIRFWVRDNGPGLTPEEQARLFTLFTRLDQVSTKGHGLGLSIVRRIVAKFGGKVGVESKTGYGSTFWFTLPAAPP